MINIINAAQENSPITVVQALDKVLEILRTSELYSPYFAQEIRDDDMTSDYLGGLVSVRLFYHTAMTVVFCVMCVNALLSFLDIQ